MGFSTRQNTDPDLWVGTIPAPLAEYIADAIAAYRGEAPVMPKVPGKGATVAEWQQFGADFESVTAAEKVYNVEHRDSIDAEHFFRNLEPRTRTPKAKPVEASAEKTAEPDSGEDSTE
jgi:hypothetical protein